MFEKTRAAIARMLMPAGKRVTTRMYHGAKDSRLTAGWGGLNSSADQEIGSSLRQLRSRSRALVRDAAYAKRAKVVIINNVIGSGIGMQAQVMNSRGELRAAVNDAIEEGWEEWSRKENCHTGGALCFEDMERMLMGEVFECGEIMVRKHFTAFGPAGVPLALEIIEPERLADEFSMNVPGAVAPGAIVKMGVELDRFYKPIAYWIRQRHPNEFLAGQDIRNDLERVPADQIIHLRIVDRWPQTRGEPWMHAVMRKLNDMDGYSEAEIIAARGAAAYMGVITTEDADNPVGEVQADGSQQMSLEPGVFERLGPGEKIDWLTPNRPNSGMDPFMRMMLREVAAGVGTSYESLSRDYSQSNYSSSRLGMLDDRDLWRVLQGWFIRNFRAEVHRAYMQQAVLSKNIQGISLLEYASTPCKFECARFKPRGWGWIDPTKEVEAYQKAVAAGFTTVSDVIAATGGGQDIEDVIKQRKRELEMMDEAGLEFTTSPDVYVAAETNGAIDASGNAVQPPAPPGGGDGGGAPAGDKPGEDAAAVAEKVGNAVAEAVRAIKPSPVLVSPHFTIEPSRVEVKAGDVHIAPAQVSVQNNLPAQAAPEVRVENNVSPTPVEVRVENKVDVPAVHVAPAAVHIENKVEPAAVLIDAPQVKVEAPQVHVDNHVSVPAARETVQTVERDASGEVTRIRTKTVG